jgi:hypothetical protein
MTEEKRKGFTYFVSREQIDAYRKWPIERRLLWLFQANKIRRALPAKVIELQDAFRKGEI